jgi:SNF2 family DNA or RNA helicase
VYKLVAEHTVEDRVLALQDRKRALFDAAVDADRAAPGLAEEDWEALLRE